MEIHFLNYSLVKLQRKDLELLRNWRNNEVHAFMIHKEYITEEMQQKWFEQIDNHHNFFFLIYKENEPVGLIDIKNIDWNMHAADTGIFIANEDYRESVVPLAATVMSAAFIAKILQLQTVYGKVLVDNKRAIAYNLSTGFKIISKEDKIVTMCIDNQHKAIENIIQLKNKLVQLHKDIADKDSNVSLYISKLADEQDKVLQWLIEHKIQTAFSSFKKNEPLNIL